MRTEEARPVRLADYRPPDWLVETVHLDVRLDPTRSPVHAMLKLRPNPAAGAPAPLNLEKSSLLEATHEIVAEVAADGVGDVVADCAQVGGPVQNENMQSVWSWHGN